MLPALLLVGLTQAADIEVAKVRPVGIGAAVGFPPSVTAKFFVDEFNGVSIHVGPTLITTGLHTRVQFEQTALRLVTWDVGDLWLSWHAGLVLNTIFGQAVSARPVRPGIHAGVGVELRLLPVPVAAFAEASPVLYPLDFLPGATFLPAGLTVAVGARWYIGQRKARVQDQEDDSPEDATEEPPREDPPRTEADESPDAPQDGPLAIPEL